MWLKAAKPIKIDKMTNLNCEMKHQNEKEIYILNKSKMQSCKERDMRCTIEALTNTQYNMNQKIMIYLLLLNLM